MAKKPLAQWVSEAADIAGGQSALAKKLTTALRRPIDRAAVNKMALGGRKITADEMLAIETITGLPVPSSHAARQVPVVDWVQAGKLAAPTSQIPLDDVPRISVGGVESGDVFALKVMGSSMDRIAPEGAIILVDRADKELVSGKYYVFALKGETTFKQWRGGETPYLAPYSTDPHHTPIFVKNRRGLEVVGRVRRSILEL